MGVSGPVVVPDATKDFSARISDGGKNAAGDDLSLNFGEPAQSVRLQAVSCPNPGNGHVIGAHARW